MTKTCKPADELEWNKIPSARSLQWMIQQQLDWLLPTVHGFSLVTFGSLAQSFNYDRAAVANVINLGKHSQADVMADVHQLPLSSDDVDGFFVPFQLEQTKEPHQMLRELVRCLRPGGELVILTFNPYSLWGLSKLLPNRRNRLPWSLPFYSVGRLADWLTVLGLDVKLINGLFNHRPGRQIDQTDTLIGSKGYSRFGAVNCLVAEKQVKTLTPIKPKWSKAKVVAGTVVKPTTRIMPRNNRAEG